MKLDDVVLTHGVTSTNKINTWIDDAIEQITINGYCVIDSGFDNAKLSTMRSRIDQIYDLQLDEVGGKENLVKIKDANTARAVCTYDDLFMETALHPKVHEVCRQILGEAYVLMTQNAIINPPQSNHYQFSWHRDINYQHFVSSKPLAVSALFCIDDFNAITGGTYVLPGSHHVENFPSDKFVLANQKVVEAPAGSILLFNCMLFHRTGKNSSNSPRRAVNHVITSPMIKQQYQFGSESFNEKLTDWQKKFFGVGAETPQSALQWRLQRIRNVNE